MATDSAGVESAWARRRPRRRRRPAGRRRLGRSAPGVEPGRRPEAGCGRSAGVRRRHRRDRRLRRRERSPDRLQRGRTQRRPDRLEHGHPAAEDRADEEHRDRRAARRARVEAGVLGKPLAEAAGEHGLCYLSGTSPDVGILGYTLGGGFSWMIRKYGLACEQRSRGRARHGRRTTRPRRQGHTSPTCSGRCAAAGATSAAVTAIELALYPVPEIYAGCFFWPIERATEILKAWREWVDTVPDECESIGRMLQLPDAPFLPEHLRGRSFVLVEPAFIGTGKRRRGARAAIPRPRARVRHRRDDADERSEPREHGSRLPAPVLGRGDPARRPAPGCDRHDGGGVRRLAPSARRGPPPGRRPALRLARRRLRRPIDQPFILFTFGFAADAEMKAAVEHHVEHLIGRFAPWDSGRRYLNFVESRVDPRLLFPEGSLRSAAGDPGQVRPPRDLRREPLHPARRLSRRVVPGSSPRVGPTLFRATTRPRMIVDRPKRWEWRDSATTEARVAT